MFELLVLVLFCLIFFGSIRLMFKIAWGIGKNTCSNSACFGPALAYRLSFVCQRCNFACADCIGIHRVGSVENLLKEEKKWEK